MAQTCAYQLRNSDIRVNSICPGLIETGMTSRMFEYAAARGTTSKIGQLNPQGRYGVAQGTFSLFLSQLAKMLKGPVAGRDREHGALPRVGRIELRQRPELRCRRWLVGFTSGRSRQVVVDHLTEKLPSVQFRRVNKRSHVEERHSVNLKAVFSVDLCWAFSCCTRTSACIRIKCSLLASEST